MDGAPASSAPPIAMEVLGPLTIAVMFNTFLYGLCVLQFITYCMSGSKDRLGIRLLVYWELFINTFHSAIMVYMLWLYAVNNFMNEKFLLTSPWPYNLNGILIVFSVTPIQIFLSHRVKKLSGSQAVFIGLLILSLIEGILAAAMSGSVWSKAGLVKIAYLVAFGNSCMASLVLSDVTISACLTYYLWKNRTGFHQIDHVIARLIREAVECAVFASFFAIMALVSFTVWPAISIGAVFLIPMSKIHANTFLAILNSRQGLRRQLHEDPHPEESLDAAAVRRNRIEQSGLVGTSTATITNLSSRVTLTTLGSLQLSSYSGQTISAPPTGYSTVS